MGGAPGDRGRLSLVNVDRLARALSVDLPTSVTGVEAKRKDPDAQSLAILVAALQKTLDRQEIWTGSAGSTVAPSPFRAYPLAHLV